jgi:hypothetical protein
MGSLQTAAVVVESGKDGIERKRQSTLQPLDHLLHGRLAGMSLGAALRFFRVNDSST